MSRAVLPIAAAAAVLAVGVGSQSASGRVTCGRPTPVDRSAPLGRATPIAGPLWLAVYPYEAGTPTKAIVMSQRPLEQPVVLRGWDCASGRPLRFWYREGLPFAHVPVTPAALRRKGALSARFGPWPAHAMRGGYLMIWHSGRWKIAAYREGRSVGTAIIATSAE